MSGSVGYHTAFAKSKKRGTKTGIWAGFAVSSIIKRENPPLLRMYFQKTGISR
jgi:hypothetical protein